MNVFHADKHEISKNEIPRMQQDLCLFAVYPLLVPLRR